MVNRKCIKQCKQFWKTNIFRSLKFYLSLTSTKFNNVAEITDGNLCRLIQADLLKFSFSFENRPTKFQQLPFGLKVSERVDVLTTFIENNF